MTPEELLETMTGMFLPPSAMGEVNGLKVLCLQGENTALKAEVERLYRLVIDLTRLTLEETAYQNPKGKTNHHSPQPYYSKVV